MNISFVWRISIATNLRPSAVYIYTLDEEQVVIEADDKNRTRWRVATFQVVSRQFTDRIFDHFTDRALGIRVEEDNLFLFLALDNDSSPCSEIGPSHCPLFSTPK